MRRTLSLLVVCLVVAIAAVAYATSEPSTAPARSDGGALVAAEAESLMQPQIPVESLEKLVSDGDSMTCNVMIAIDRTGTVTQAAAVTQSADGWTEVDQQVWSVFEEAAVEACLKSRFKPATQQGEAVACRIVMPFTFTLSD